MWRSLRDRPALRGPWTEAGTPRGQPCRVAHRLPPPLPTGCPAFPTFPPPGGLTAANTNTRFEIFQTPLRGFRPCALRLPEAGRGMGDGCPFFPAKPKGEGEPANEPGEPRRGAPGGSTGRPKAGQGGGTPPPRGGPDHPPLGGFWRGRGSRPEGGGTPQGCPVNVPKTVRKQTKNAALKSLRERKFFSLCFQ